jgi:DDE superfamily endonuclease/Helix-turn-helix of DDE superfamily endonuclease
MIKYTKLKQNRRKLLALTGLTLKEFEALLPAFRRAYERRYPPNRTLTRRPRQRRAGGGRKSHLDSVEQKLLFVLVYQKTYPLQVLLGVTFEMSQARANQWLHRLLPVLHQALADLGVMPERNPRQFAAHERRRGEKLDLTIDGTERRRQRPKNPEKQALHYSGKKKAHSDKNVVIVNTRTKRVGYLSQTYAGKTHDKKIADTERIAYPREATLRKDTGFQGYEPRVAQTHQPKKSHPRAN